MGSSSDSDSAYVEVTLDVTDDTVRVAEVKLLAEAEHTENCERIKWPDNSIFRAPAHIRTGREPNLTLERTYDTVRVIGVRSIATAEHTESCERIQWPDNSIFHAPAHIRSGRESNFEPKLVSIGPYYHGRQNLKRLEHLKFRCMKELWRKQALRVRSRPQPLQEGIPHRRNRTIYNVSVDPSTQGGRGIEDMPLEQFMDSGKKARAYYKEEFDHSDDEFVRMLVLDSCFIIRIILSLSQQVQESMAFIDVHIKDVKSDLLLLENQIPLFFIREVYEWLFIHRDGVSPFNTVLEQFICLDMPWRINGGSMCSIGAAHLLDLYWRCSLSPQMYKKHIAEHEGDLPEQEGDPIEQEGDPIEQDGDLFEQEEDLLIDALSRPTLIELQHHKPAGRKHFFEFPFRTTATGIQAPTSTMVIANASELHKMVGVKFKKFQHRSYLDVTFSKGIMRMPHLKIDTRQTTLLVNVIAFENCISPSMRNFSCYMKLMDALIDSEKDIELLQKCGVIYNTLSSHKMATTFFNDIGNICFIHNKANRFSGLYKNVDRYYNSSWRRRSVSLRHNYFSSPWAGISVVAGVTLLILSALQTFYTIYGYYQQKNRSPGSH